MAAAKSNNRATARLKVSLAAARKRADEARRINDKLRQKITKLERDIETARTRHPPPSKPPDAIAKLPPPPADPLKAQEYTYQVLMIQLYETAKDTQISSRERSQRLATLAAAAQALMPRVRLYQAEQIVLRNQADLARKVRDRRGAKLEKLATPKSSAEHGIEEPRE